jgi:uncharacterized protein (DUF2461 family)
MCSFAALAAHIQPTLCFMCVCIYAIQADMLREMLEQIMDDEDELREINLSSRPRREERRKQRERERMERQLTRSATWTAQTCTCAVYRNSAMYQSFTNTGASEAKAF